MYTQGNSLALLRRVLSGSYLAKNPLALVTSTKYSTICLNQDEEVIEEGVDHQKNESTDSIDGLVDHSKTQKEAAEILRPSDSVGLLKKWGCIDEDISKLLLCQPSLCNAKVTQLQGKLSLLKELGITSSDLVKIVNFRPRFLSSRIDRFFNERINFFVNLYGSREMVRKAITRNPSLMTFDLREKIKPVIALYLRLGLAREDIVPMLESRPTLIPRTTFNAEKMEYIRKTGVTKDSKMFKYVVSIVGISKMETICEKVANLEKFGFTDEEVWHLFGKSPFVLTLSVDKVQRNMTYALASMKLDADLVLQHPFLLYSNLETHLRPRLLLAGKILETGLQPDMKEKELLLTALRMTEKRFLKAYVWCHPKEVANKLLAFYERAKCIQRLAEESKKTVRKWFPF